DRLRPGIPRGELLDRTAPSAPRGEGARHRGRAWPDRRGPARRCRCRCCEMTESTEVGGTGLDLRLPEPAQRSYQEAVRRAVDQRWVARLFERDVSLWSADRRV